MERKRSKRKRGLDEWESKRVWRQAGGRCGNNWKGKRGCAFMQLLLLLDLLLRMPNKLMLLLPSLKRTSPLFEKALITLSREALQVNAFEVNF